MKKTMFGQKVFLMRFLEAYTGREGGKLTQVAAAQLFGVSERTFRRQLAWSEKSGFNTKLLKI